MSSAFTVLDYTVLGLYLAVLIGIGVVLARRERTTEDFFLAGRRMPWWAAGLSIFGTQLSAITFMAVPAKVFAEDWTYFLVNVTIVLVAPIVVWFYLPFFRRLNVTTAYEYLERRFSLAVRWFGSLSFLLFQLGRMAIVVALPALALAAVTGLNVYACVLVMGILSTVYTVLGGIEAVIWTDVLQVFVLIGGALLSLGLIAAGLDGGTAEIIARGEAAGKFHLVDWTWDYTTTALWVVLVGNVFSNLIPYTTDQTVIQRYLTTADERDARRAIWTNAALSVPAAFVFFSVGTALFAFYQAHPERLPDDLATDGIFPWFIAQELPAGLAGLVIAGLFAAAMSSLDSSMNSMATAIVTDFYGRLRPESSDAFRLRLARWLTVGLGVIGTATALALAAYEVQSLWDTFLALMGLFGGSLAGIFMLGVFTTRTTARGALVGGVVSAVVLALVQRTTDVHFMLYALVGILTCVAVGYLVSLVRPARLDTLDGLTVHTLGRKALSFAPRLPSS